MAHRLGEHLVYGELHNDQQFRTWGRLFFATERKDEPHPVHVQLMGDCAPDLQGKWVRFYPADEDAPVPPMPVEDRKSIGLDQIGATGTMTAQGWVRELPCSPEEFYTRAKLGEPPPTTWARHLYLEWYGQNGRIVVETSGFVVERCVTPPADMDDEGEWQEEPNLAFPDSALSGETKPSDPGITRIQASEDDLSVQHFDFDAGEFDAEESDEDPLRDMKLLDECIDHATETPVLQLMRGKSELPAPDSLDDEQIESALKSLASQLAMFNITVDTCEHCTPRYCYTLLVEKILPDTGVFEELIGSTMIHHVCAYEYCDACIAASDAEYDGTTPPF